jgi:hypothetical protein
VNYDVDGFYRVRPDIADFFDFFGKLVLILPLSLCHRDHHLVDGTTLTYLSFETNLFAPESSA